METNPQELVNGVSDLVSLPEVCIRVTELIDDPDSTADGVGKVISQDPALTIKLLKIANSSFYGFSTEIATVSKAVAVLGTKQIRDLVLATSVSKAFNGINNELVTMKNFWKHSIFCGLTARIIAYESRKAKGESVFIAGLLHDIGQLIMFSKLPDLSKEALMLSVEGPEEMTLCDAEQQVFGFDHTQVGAELIQHWKLPVSIQECVEFHHDPVKAKEFPVEAAVIHLANSLACMAELEIFDESEMKKIDPAIWPILELDGEIMSPVVSGAQAQIAEVQSLLLMD